MLKKVCFFNYKIFIPDLDSSIHFQSIVVFEYTRNKQNLLSFQESFKLKIPSPNDFYPKQAFLDTVENYTSGLKSLIAVIFSKNKIATFMYCRTLKNSLIFMQMLPLPSSNVEVNKNLFITDGPMLILHCGKELFFHSLCQKTKHSLDLTSYCNDNQFKILQCSAVGQSQDEKSLSLLLIALSYRDDFDKNHINIVVVAVNTKNNSNAVIDQSIPVNYFYPEPYQSDILSLVITNVSAVKFKALSKTKTLTKDNMKMVLCICKENHTFVCTSSNLLIFHNAELKYACYLPDSGVRWTIKSDLWESTTQPSSLLLISENQDVHLVKKSLLNRLQATKSWRNIDCVLIGIVRAGDSKKLLLLRNCFLHSWQEEIVYCDINNDFPMDLMNQTEIPTAAIEKTIPGISANVEAGKLAVGEAETDISQKIGATLDALYKIKKEFPKENTVAQHIISFQESLLDILLYPAKQGMQNDPEISREYVSLRKHWNHLIGHRLLLCWQFSNVDERPICHPSIKIFIGNQQINCVQKVFHDKGAEAADDAPQIIYPKEEFYIYVSLEILDCPFKEINIDGILSGYIGELQDWVLPLEEEICHFQKSLKTSLSSSSFEEELKDISQHIDLRYFKINQHRTLFSVSTLKSNLDKIENFMSPCAETEPLILLENMGKESSKRTMFFKNPSSKFYGMSMTFQNSQVDGFEIEIFTSSELNTSLLVKSLYSHLGSDVLILPLGLTSQEQRVMKKKAICAMKAEVDLLLSAIYINSGIQHLNLEENARITKQQFLKMRSSVARKEAVTDNIMQNLYLFYSLSANT